MQTTRIEVSHTHYDAYHGTEFSISCGTFDLLHFLKRSVALGLHSNSQEIEVKVVGGK